MYNNSTLIGNIGEAVAISEFTKYGIPVLIPFSQNLPYDLVIQVDNKFYKIQCKTTSRIKNGKMEFYINRTNGFTGEHVHYNKHEVDYFFVYCVENEYIGIIPIEDVKDVKYTISLRLSNSKNNQKKNCRLASTYDIINQICSLGK